MNKIISATRRMVCASIAIVAMSPLFVACESSDAVDPLNVVHDNSSSASSNISGTWVGVSGSGKSQTTVTVSDKNGAVSGTLKWSWGGVRKFSGSRTGNTVVWTTQADSEGVRDTWSMTLSSNNNKLSGHASKSDGGGYSISLSRK